MILGIDLGTTNSAVAIWDEGRARLLKTRYGHELLPSVVSLLKDDTLLVGNPARDQAELNIEQSFSVFKRAMGTRKKFGRKNFDAVSLSSIILRTLKEDAEAELGQSIQEAIITVPAYFNEPQRKDTRRAAELAGLKVRRLLNEPTAAAIAYSLNETAYDCKIMVLDLGGGTFDISIIEKFEDVLDIHASGGDCFLGGEDFTAVVRSLLAAQMPPAYQQDHRLQRLAELCKKALTHALEWSGELLADGRVIPLALTRQQFEEASQDLMDRLRLPIERAFRDARLKPADLDHIVLAGGATRMPMIRQFVSHSFKKFPLFHIDPDTVVAQGAAIVCGMEAQEQSLRDRVLTDICPFTLGVEIQEGASSGIFSPIIERNQKIPISRESAYRPIEAEQKFIRLRIFQGESRQVSDNVLLGELQIPITKRPANHELVKVRFTYDISGLLEVDAEVESTAIRKSLAIMNPGTELSESEMNARRELIAGLKIHPRDTAEVKGLIARGQRLYQEHLGETRQQISRALTLLEHCVMQQDSELIQQLTQQMDTFFASLEKELPQ